MRRQRKTKTKRDANGILKLNGMPMENKNKMGRQWKTKIK